MEKKNSKNNVRYSFIVPIYNNEKFLEKCVKSIEEQSAIGLEVILVNDGSDDSSLTIANALAKEYKNIKVLSQTNKGQSSARKLGISQSKGEYICFVDSDDWLYKNYLEKIDSFRIKYNNPDLIFFNATEVHADFKKLLPYSGTIKKEYYNKNSIVSELRKCLIYPNKYGFPIRWHAWGSVYKKEFLIKHIVEDDSIRVAEDGITIALCVYYANSICFINEALYYYNCCNSNSIGNTFGKWNYLEYYEYLEKEFKSVDNDIVNQLYTHYLYSLNVGYFKNFILENKEIKIIASDFYNKEQKFYKFFEKIHVSKEIPFKYRFLFLMIKKNSLKQYLYIFKIYLKIKPKN